MDNQERFNKRGRDFEERLHPLSKKSKLDSSQLESFRRHDKIMHAAWEMQSAREMKMLNVDKRLTEQGKFPAWERIEPDQKKEAQGLLSGQTTSDATISQPKAPGRIELPSWEVLQDEESSSDSEAASLLSTDNKGQKPVYRSVLSEAGPSNPQSHGELTFKPHERRELPKDEIDQIGKQLATLRHQYLDQLLEEGKLYQFDHGPNSKYSLYPSRPSDHPGQGSVSGASRQSEVRLSPQESFDTLMRSIRGKKNHASTDPIAKPFLETIYTHLCNVASNVPVYDNQGTDRRIISRQELQNICLNYKGNSVYIEGNRKFKDFMDYNFILNLRKVLDVRQNR